MIGSAVSWYTMKDDNVHDIACWECADVFAGVPVG